ncbi:unnamed protein product [Meganyctiphanes norvegica]|uniref:Phospholipid scramblase n=1 Tax=Meganyctiphanes norvegica TaxID=48144 RepID=A0AAV2RIU2_MEGNR
MASYTIPPGLEYLFQLDQVLIKQKIQVFELLSGCDMKNKYELRNSVDQPFGMAKEESSCITRQCCGPSRSFDMEITDTNEMEIIHLHRPFKCGGSCCYVCKGCLQMIEVQAPPGTPIGSVHQEFSFCTPFACKYTVRNQAGEIILRIEGPNCPCSCGSDVEFKVLSEDNSTLIGKITKQWRGCCTEALTDADNFCVTFPLDLEIRYKAILVGATFLIDFMFFEKRKR